VIRRMLLAAGIAGIALVIGLLTPAGVIAFAFVAILAGMFARPLRPLRSLGLGALVLGILTSIDPPAPWLLIFASMACLGIAAMPGIARVRSHPSVRGGRHTPGITGAQHQRRIDSAGRHERGSVTRWR
jgi:hypothetical protein